VLQILVDGHHQRDHAAADRLLLLVVGGVVEQRRLARTRRRRVGVLDVAVVAVDAEARVECLHHEIDLFARPVLRQDLELHRRRSAGTRRRRLPRRKRGRGQPDDRRGDEDGSPARQSVAHHDPAYSGRVGTSTGGGTTRTNCPRCSSSRPLPPRLVTSYFAVLIVCSAPRVVSTIIRSRSPVDAMKPSSRSSAGCSLIRMTPRPGPLRKFTSSRPHSIARACRVAAMIVSCPVTRATPTTSTPSGTRAKRRPVRVLASTKGSSEKRRL